MQNKYIISISVTLLFASAIFSFYHLKNTVGKSAVGMKPEENMIGVQTPDSVKYRDFDPTVFNLDTGRKRVYYFYASWCPDSLKIDRRLGRGSDPIPVGVVIYKMDYDNEKELESQLGVEEQNTFVAVDASGKVSGIWHAESADDLAGILEELK